MRIHILNTVSGFGSTGDIANKLQDHLKNLGNDVKLFYGRGSKTSRSDRIRLQGNVGTFLNFILSYSTGYGSIFSRVSTNRYLKIFHQDKPDMIICMNLHGYYLNYIRLLNSLKIVKVKVLFVLFDEFLLAGKCCFTLDCEKFRSGCRDCPQLGSYPKSLYFDRSKWLFDSKKKIFQDWSEAEFVSVEYTINKLKQSGVLKSRRSHVITEGVDVTEVFKPMDVLEAREMCKKYVSVIDNRKVILAVGSYKDKRKGMKFFLELASNFRDEEGYIFVNVGYDGKGSNLPSNFFPVGYIHDKRELSAFYNIAEFFVLFSLDETIANTAMQALACGTPVLAFNSGGASYMGSPPEITLFEPGNVRSVSSFIKSCGVDYKEMYSESCRKYAVMTYDEKEYYPALGELIMNMGKE